MLRRPIILHTDVTLTVKKSFINGKTSMRSYWPLRLQIGLFLSQLICPKTEQIIFEKTRILFQEVD